jgi:hypothetical protein
LKLVAMVLLAVMTAFIVVQVTARNVFDAGLPWAEELARYAGLGVVYLAAPLLLLNGKHIKVDMLVDKVHGTAGRVLRVVNEMRRAGLCAGLLVGRLALHAKGGALQHRRAGHSQLAVLHAGHVGHGAVCAGGGGACRARPAARGRCGARGRTMMSLSVLLIFLVTMMMGVPIAVAMGFAAAVVIGFNDMPLAVLAQRTINALDSVPLLAVPMFILAASLFGASGITKHLFVLIRLVVGGIRGGLGHVTVLANLVFSGISGAALADIGALGGTQIKMMREQGYATNLPPASPWRRPPSGPSSRPAFRSSSLPRSAEVSAVKVLLAGALPALVIAAMLMLQIGIMARRQNLPRDVRKPRRPDAGAGLREGLPGAAGAGDPDRRPGQRPFRPH